MNKRSVGWRAFELEQIKSDEMDLDQKYRILDALYEEAVMLGTLPPKDSLEGIEDKISLSFKLKGIKKSPEEIRALVARYRKQR